MTTKAAAVIIIGLFLGAAQGGVLTLSKDSLWCINSTTPALTDFTVISNPADYTITSDSTCLRITQIDPGFTAARAGQPLRVTLSMNNNGFSYACDSVGPLTYKLRDAVMNVSGFGGSVTLDRFRFGVNPTSTSPVFPQYWRGELTVYFSTYSDTVNIKLYTSGPPSSVRTPLRILPQTARSRAQEKSYRINGRIAGRQQADAVLIHTAGTTVRPVIRDGR